MENKIKNKETINLIESIISKSPMIYELYDSEGYLIEANQAALDLFGVPSMSDMKGYNFFNEVNMTPEIEEKVRNKEIARFKMEYSFDLVREKRSYPTTKTGTIFIDLIITPITIKVNGDNQQFYLIQVQDISDWIELQRSLILRERQYSLLFNHMKSGFCYFEIMLNSHGEPEDLMIREANSYLMERLNKRRDELVNSLVSKLFPNYKNEYPDFYKVILDCGLEGKEFSEELYLSYLYGWYHFTVYSPAKNFISVLFINIDEKKKKENFQKQKYNLFKHSLENAPVPLVIIDSNGTINLSNTRFNRIIGLSEEKLLQSNYYQFMTEESQIKTKEFLKQYQAGDYQEFSSQITIINEKKVETEYFQKGSFIPLEMENSYKIIVTLSKKLRKTEKENKILSSLQFIQQELEELISDVNPKDSKEVFEKKIGEKLRKFKLNDKEMMLVNYILDGLTNKKIALKYFVSEIAVKKWVAEIYKKIGVKNREELFNLLKIK